MKFTNAITRRPGKNVVRGIPTANIGPPNYQLILEQHISYVDTLKSIGLKIIELDAQQDYPDAHFVAEEYAANVLWINDHLLIPTGFPETKKKLTALGSSIIELDVSEMRKMDGGLTCLSIRF